MPDTPLKISCRKCGQHLDLSLLEPFSTFHCPRCGEGGSVPLRFERYLLERRIGRGGMAKVYLAREEESGMVAAVKIRTPPSAELAAWEERFQNECLWLAPVDHPHILKHFRSGRVRDKVFLVMEYPGGSDLEKLQQTPPLPPVALRCEWISQAAKGLSALSWAGLVHHDVKPSNLLQCADDRIRICDFDLLENRLANAGGLLPLYGSPDYVSPERLNSGCEDERGDIFSLGATAYELLTGRCPFPAGKNEAEMLKIRREYTPDAPRELQPELSQKLSDLILKMLAFSPENRPQYAEIVRAFHECTPVIQLKGGSLC